MRDRKPAPVLTHPPVLAPPSMQSMHADSVPLRQRTMRGRGGRRRPKGGCPRQYRINNHPNNIPPRCAKCATPGCAPEMPSNNSMTP
jgi:hypothetical protein